jgi:hypothetical protein
MTRIVRIVDSETWPIARARLAPKPVCVQSKVVGGGPAKIWRRADAIPHIARWLLGSDLLVGINIGFDLASWCAYFPQLIPHVFAKYKRHEIQDLGINLKIVDVAYGKHWEEYGADGLFERFHLPSDKQNEWRTSFWKLDGMHPDEYPRSARRYALDDVELPALIYPQIEELAARFERKLGKPCLHIAAEKARAAWPLHLDSCWGVHTNRRRTEVYRDRTVLALRKTRRRLQRTYVPVREPNPKFWGKKKDGIQIGKDGRYRAPFVRPNGKAIRLTGQTYMRMLCKRRGKEVPITKPDKKTGKGGGGVSLDANAVEMINSPLLAEVAKYGSQRKIMARCADLAKGYDYPLQARFNAMLKTGRTSCSKPDAKKKRSEIKAWDPVGTQLQNPDKAQGVRECFDPPEIPLGEWCELNGIELLKDWDPLDDEWLFFDADFPSAELHALAQVQMCWFGKSKLGQLLNEGKDVLLWFGATILNGIPYEKALERKKAGDPAIKDMRQMAKAYIYGLPGGLGAEKMVTYARTNYNVIINEARAKKDKAIWMEALDMGPYFNHIKRKISDVTDKGFLCDPISGMWRGNAFPTELFNFPFQRITAGGACDAAFHVADEMINHLHRGKSALYGTRGWNFVHDQIIGAGPRVLVADAADRLGALMTARYNTWTPDVPIKEGKTEGCVMRVWSKGAEPVRDAVTKKLVPWEPCLPGCEKKKPCRECQRRTVITTRGLEHWDERKAA